MATDSALEVIPANQPTRAHVNVWPRVGIALIAGLIQAICFPPIGWAVLLPFCVAAFLFAIEPLDVKMAFRVGFVYGLAWYLGDLFWFSRIFGPAAVSLCAILAFFIGLFASLMVWTRRNLPRVPALLIAAILWTGIEVYRSELFVLDFGWLGLGYGVVNRPDLAQFAPWIGCYGITFCIVLLAAALALHRDKRSRSYAMVAAVAWLGLYFAPGGSPPRPDRPLRVRLVQAASEDDQSLFKYTESTEHADAILWPEYSFVSDPRRQHPLWRRLQNLAMDHHSVFIFGGKEEVNPADPAAFRNTAFVLDTSGELVGTHVKNHTVHFFRDGIPGKDASAINTPIGRIGVGICFDMDYPDVARRLVQDGAEVFLIPNDDPDDWGPIQRSQHRLMFQMRAAECGRWLARADVAGGTSAAAPNGREVARIGATGPGSLTVIIGRETAITPFVRGGWMFGRICLGISAALVCWSAALAWRSRRLRDARADATGG